MSAPPSRTTTSLLSIGKFYHPRSGGVEIVAQEIAEEAVRRGARSTVLCFDADRDAEETIAGVRVVRYRARMLGPAPLALRFLRELRAHAAAADAIVLHYPNPLAEAGHVLLGSSRPRTFVFYHGDLIRYRFPVDRLYWGFSRYALRRADTIITTSPNYAQGSPVIRNMTDRIRVVPLATDTDRFRPLQHVDLPHIPFPRRVLFVGRFSRFKGLDVLLSSLKGLPQDCGAVLIGDGPLRASVEALRDALGLGARVLLPGIVPNADLPRWYNACHVFVLPSTLRSESFGVVSLEAMACGLPIVTTELGTGTTLYNRDGVTGRIVPPANDEALAVAIADCLEHRETFGQAGRIEVERRYSLPAFREAIGDVLGLPHAGPAVTAPSH